MFSPAKNTDPQESLTESDTEAISEPHEDSDEIVEGSVESEREVRLSKFVRKECTNTI